MFSVLLGLLSATPITVASPGFQAVNVEEKVAGFALEHLSERLGRLGIRVITPTEIQAILGLERQRQLLGCGESNTSCAAELGDALGAESTMIGTLARLGDTLELSIKVVSNRTGERRAGFSERVKSESELLELMDEAATSLAQQLLPPTAVVPGVSQPAPGLRLRLRNRALIPVVIGAVFAVASGTMYGLAFAAHADLTNAALPPPANGTTRAAEGQTFQTLSAVFAGATVASAAVALWFYVSGAPPPLLTASLGLVGGAPAFTFGGRFP